MGPGNIEGIKNKYVAFGLGQNPFMQGFYPVMMVYQAKKYGIRPVTIDTGTDVVMPEISPSTIQSIARRPSRPAARERFPRRQLAGI